MLCHWLRVYSHLHPLHTGQPLHTVHALHTHRRRLAVPALHIGQLLQIVSVRACTLCMQDGLLNIQGTLFSGLHCIYLVLLGAMKHFIFTQLLCGMHKRLFLPLTSHI